MRRQVVFNQLIRSDFLHKL